MQNSAVDTVKIADVDLRVYRDRVVFINPMDRESVFSLKHQADIMVHPDYFETTVREVVSRHSDTQLSPEDVQPIQQKDMDRPLVFEDVYTAVRHGLEVAVALWDREPPTQVELHMDEIRVMTAIVLTHDMFVSKFALHPTMWDMACEKMCLTLASKIRSAKVDRAQMLSRIQVISPDCVEMEDDDEEDEEHTSAVFGDRRSRDDIDYVIMLVFSSISSRLYLDVDETVEEIMKQASSSENGDGNTNSVRGGGEWCPSLGGDKYKSRGRKLAATYIDFLRKMEQERTRRREEDRSRSTKRNDRERSSAVRKNNRTATSASGSGSKVTRAPSRGSAASILSMGAALTLLSSLRGCDRRGRCSA